MSTEKEEQSNISAADIGTSNGTMTKWEKWKRARAIRKIKRMFRAIDVLFRLPQNSCPYVNKYNRDTIFAQNDIAYSDADEICKLDFYRTKSEEKLPAIILIHGGGFTAGDKKYRKGRSQFLALNGFAVFSINYGLAPKYTFPKPLEHVITASNFVYDNAERFNIDAEKIFVGGDSAGAYYAAMLAAFNCTDKLRDAFGMAPKFKIFGALLNCGVYDIKAAFDKKMPLKIDEGVILGLTGERPEKLDTYRYAEVCSPIELVNKDFPPSFLIFSDNDIFCRGQGDLMVDKLNESGAYCEYYSAHDANSNHCFSLTWNGEDAAAANELLLSFAIRLASDKIKLS